MIKEKRTTKTKITQAEYNQLLGLRMLCEKYNRILDEIYEAAQEITGELDNISGEPELYGYTCDYLNVGGGDIKHLLKMLDLKKVKK
jgi:hypothetical protein